MELLLAAVIGGVLLAVVMMMLIWMVVSRAVENGLDWLVHTFGNERAASEVEDKWGRRDEVKGDRESENR